MLRQCDPAVVSTLSALPRNASVRVVVRGGVHGPEAASASIDPKDFASAVEYRTALIRQHKLRTGHAKADLAEHARALGLVARAAGALNAVLVEGPPLQVLKLLEQVNVESAILDGSMDLRPLPKPR